MSDVPIGEAPSSSPSEPDPVDQVAAVADRIDYPDSDAAHATRLRQAALVLPSGSLGRLADFAAWISGAQGSCPPADFDRARLVLFAADHGIAGPDVSGQPAGQLAQLVRHLLHGGGAPNVLAPSAGVTVRLADLAVDADTDEVVSDYKIRRSSGLIDREDALSHDETRRALAAGCALADAEIDAGADLLLLGSLGRAADVAASVLIAVLTDTEPVRVTGRAAGTDDARWIAACTAIRDARRRGRPRRDNVADLLAAVGGADLAAMTGFILQAAHRKTPLIVDGLAAVAAALVAQRATVRIVRWIQVGQRTGHPAEAIALERLGLDPILDLGISAGEGAGALLAVPLVRAAVRTLGEMLSYDEAGVDRPLV